MEKYYFLIVILAGLGFVLAHEFGHFAAADLFGLEPKFVLGTQPDYALLGFFIGISHLSGSAAAEAFVILGASAIPLIISLSLLFISKAFDLKELDFISKIFFILIVVNLIPLPGIEMADASKLLKIFLPG